MIRPADDDGEGGEGGEGGAVGGGAAAAGAAAAPPVPRGDIADLERGQIVPQLRPSASAHSANLL